jgi:hypothetical protein
MARRCPRAPKRVMSLEKVCEGRIHLRKERRKLMDREKWLKETRFGVGLMSNSNFLNGDIKIMGLVIPNFDKKIFVSLLLYLPLYLLVLLCFRFISCDVIYCLVDIIYIYIYLYVSLEAHCIYNMN